MHTRPMRPDDRTCVVELWHRTRKATYDFLPTERGVTLAHSFRVFDEVIAPRCELWVAEADGQLLGFLALAGSYVDRLYVDPHSQRRGVGTLLLARARARSPERLELHTHQANTGARAFYEKHGFRAVRFGLSPAPERAPDVEYQWRPPAPPT